MPSTAPAVARADRSCLASVAVRAQPVVLPDPVAADRGAAVLSAPRRERAAGRIGGRRLRPPHRDLLAFGPIATVLALSAVSGRGTVAMWGYPLWLFLGLWLVLTARRALDGRRLARMLLTWAIVFVGLALAFIGNYAVLPHYDHRYRAVFFPGGELGARIVATLSRRHRPADRLRHRQHVGRRQCRALRAEPSARADRRQAGARAVDRSHRSARARRAWWCGPTAIRNAMPVQFRNDRRRRRGAAAVPCCPTGAAIGSITVGWAILLPKPSSRWRD